MLSAANDPATTTAERDMDEILAREGFEAAPVDHSDDASKESTTKRAREVCKQLSTMHSLITRAVEASGTTGSGPTGAVLPGARRLMQNATGTSAKAAEARGRMFDPRRFNQRLDGIAEVTEEGKIVRTDGLKKWLEKVSLDLEEEETEEAVMPVASEGRRGEDRKSLYQCFVRGDPNGRD